MRTAVAAFTAFYNLHLGRDWKRFGLVRSPSPTALPTVLTRAEVLRLFDAIREERFRTVLRSIHACGLRVAYRQLSTEERYSIAAMRAQRLGAQAIADALHRHRSTIDREVERNSSEYGGGYRPMFAVEKANGRRRRSRRNRRYTV